MKVIHYPNGNIMWDGENLFHNNGKIAWKDGMAYYFNEQVAYAGNKGFHPNGEIAWDGIRALDIDGTFLSNFGVALKLNSVIDLLCDKAAITANISKRKIILLKKF